MIYLLTTLHVIFCLFLIMVILLQTGKGGGMGAAFGGSGSTVFGPRGAGSFIGKLTGTVAFLFMISSITLAYMSSSKSSGLQKKAALMEMESTGDEVELPEAAPVEAPPAQEVELPKDNPSADRADSDIPQLPEDTAAGAADTAQDEHNSAVPSDATPAAEEKPAVPVAAPTVEKPAVPAAAPAVEKPAAPAVEELAAPAAAPVDEKPAAEPTVE